MSIFVRLLAFVLFYSSANALFAAAPAEQRRVQESRSRERAQQDSRPREPRKSGANAVRGNGKMTVRGAYGDAELQKLQRQAASLHRQIQYSMQRNTGRDSIRRLRHELDEVLERIRVHRAEVSRRAATQRPKEGARGENRGRKQRPAKPAERPSRTTSKDPRGQRPQNSAESGRRASQQKPRESGRRSSPKPAAQPQPNKQKPAEQKPAEQKPAEQKPRGQKPRDQKPSDQKPRGQKTDTNTTGSKKPGQQAGPRPSSESPVGPTGSSAGSIISGPIVGHDIILTGNGGHSPYQRLLQYQHCPPDLTANYINHAIHHLHAAGLSHHATALSGLHPADESAPAIQHTNVQQLHDEIAVLKRQLAEIHAQQQK